MSYELQEISGLKTRLDKLEADNELLKTAAGPEIQKVLDARKKAEADAEAVKNFSLSDKEKLEIIESRKRAEAPKE